MSQSATYHTNVSWKGEHWGHLVLGNGPSMDFSAPPDSQGHEGVLTPEDAFVAAANTCIMMMFLWAAERFKLHLLSYECRAEGVKKIELDRTEIFTTLRLEPVIHIDAGGEQVAAVRSRIDRALQAARKYSLIANSVKSEVIIDPQIHIHKEKSKMVTIKVLGSGCPNCQKVEQIARQALHSLGVDAEVIKVTDHSKIQAYNILATPGLVINEKLVSAGRIPSLAEVTTWLTDAMN